MVQYVFRSSAGMPLPHPKIPLDVGMLLQEPCQDNYHIEVGDIGDDEVDCMALLRHGAVPHTYNVVYDRDSVQRLTINGGDRQ